MTRPPTITEQGLGYAWQQLRRRILARDHYRCHWCGRRANTVDHLTPRAQGGARYDPSNLVAACQTCNSRRGGQLAARLHPAAAKRHALRAQRRVWSGAIPEP